MSRGKSKSKKRSSKSEASDVDNKDLIELLEPTPPFIDLGVTNCAICRGSDNDDVVLMCDGNGCKNEIHMYCLCPPITAVPEGDWLCPACDPDGTSLFIERELQKCGLSFKDAISKHIINDSNAYLQWRRGKQQQHYSMDEWRPNCLSDEFWIPAEFDENSVDLIGSIVRVYSSGDDQTHTGRIISRRWNAFCVYDPGNDIDNDNHMSTSESTLLSADKDNNSNKQVTESAEIFNKQDTLPDTDTDLERINGRWEHLVHFRKGGDGRNRDVVQWVNLEEVPCSVGGPVVWAKVHGSPWWPAQIMLRSGIELIRTKERNVFEELGNKKNNSPQKSSGPPSSSSSSKTVPASARSESASTSPLSVLGIPRLDGAAHRMLIRFFLDGSVSMMTPEQAAVSLMPFSERPRELKSGMSKVCEKMLLQK